MTIEKIRSPKIEVLSRVRTRTRATRKE